MGQRKRKFNSFDEGFALPGFEPQWQSQWKQQWQPEQVAASQTQFPWMAAAAPIQPPGDPWSQWGGQGFQQQQWPGAGSFHSLAPGPRQIFSIFMKKMPTAAVPQRPFQRAVCSARSRTILAPNGKPRRYR